MYNGPVALNVNATHVSEQVSDDDDRLQLGSLAMAALALHSPINREEEES